jgi:hypothetical protein
MNETNIIAVGNPDALGKKGIVIKQIVFRHREMIFSEPNENKRQKKKDSKILIRYNIPHESR